MGFGTELQTQHSHECLVKLQDTEIKLLEVIKKCVTHRIKCDRDYAQSLSQLTVIAGKFDNPERYTSPLFKAWSTIVSETEKISLQLKTNADRMCGSTIEKLVELINEKKLARKAYVDERHRLESSFLKLQERLRKCHGEYQKCLTKVTTERCKYEDTVAKGKSGKKLEDQKSKYVKSLGSLHYTHNEYVCDIQQLGVHQKDYLHTTLPGLLDYQQGLLESMTQQSKEILQEYSSFTDTSAEEFLKCHAEVVKSVSAIYPSGEHDDFLNNSKGEPLESQKFDFDTSLVEENCPNLQPNAISLNNVTKDTLEQKASTYNTEATVLRDRIDSKKEELQKCEQEMGELPPLNTMNDHDKNSHYNLKKKAQVLRKDIAELTCQWEKFEMLHRLVNDPLTQLGSGEPPLIIDLMDGTSLSRNSSQNSKTADTPASSQPSPHSFANATANSSSSLGESIEAHAQVAREKFNSFKKSLSDKFKRQQQSSNPPEPPSKDFLDHSSQEKDSPPMIPPEPKPRENSTGSGVSGRTSAKEVGGGSIVSELTKRLQQQGISTNPPVPEDRTPVRQNTKYEQCEVSQDKQAITSSNIVNRPIQEEDWFHGVLPREEVVRLLQNDGDYIVRESKNKKTGSVQYVLSVMWKEPKHFIIQGQENEWRFEGTSFPSIQELIREQHSNGCAVTKKSQAILRKAILREEWELSNDDIKLGIKLGNGNFGDVFKGVFKGKDVAVKTCRETLSEDQKKKFLQEGRILKQYNHPNIVRFIGIGAQRQPVMIVMEYVAGGALLNFLRAEAKKTIKKLGAKQLLKMCVDAAAGMAYLEERGCIHRDLAARNCLVGSDNVVKISDFGMSREEEEYTVSGGLKQIPIKWTAPEALNFGTYTTACDVWSYGILMWEVFSFGATPYQGLTNNQSREKVDAGYRMPAPEIMPANIEEVMTSCWEANAADRPKFEELHLNLQSIKKAM